VRRGVVDNSLPIERGQLHRSPSSMRRGRRAAHRCQRAVEVIGLAHAERFDGSCATLSAAFSISLKRNVMALSPRVSRGRRLALLPAPLPSRSRGRFALSTAAGSLTPVTFPPGPGEAGDKTGFHHVAAVDDDDRNRRGRLLRGYSRGSSEK